MTPAVRNEIYAALLERANSEPLGLAIPTNNPKAMQISFCNVQRALGQSDVVVCLPSTPGEVWLVKKSVELD